MKLNYINLRAPYRMPGLLFCSDCKTKVIKAFNILTGEMDGSGEKNFCPSIYEGIECCSMTNTGASKKSKFHLNTKHLHLKNDKHFVASLIFKAETEIQGGRRERHAKTLEIAQEEVLTCVGIHLFEKFFLIFQSIRIDEQIWQLMVYSSIVVLKKNFELRYEQLQGVSNLELVCAQLEAEKFKKEAKHKKKVKKNKAKSDEKQSNKLSMEDEEYDSENSLGCSQLSKRGEKEESDKSCDVSCLCLNESQLNGFTSLSCSSSSASSSSTDDFKDFSFSSFIIQSEMAGKDDDNLMLITDEEKNEYYANKSVYLNERTNRRMMLQERFQNLKLNANFKLRPRN
ncbi:Gametogenetin-binding 2 [Brachionus plicatilis]|uniref:Gametogenetin-binding 2 n=1 Tax=Brachionus plicatilis TaxID=10195 RepID=A0A3M7QQ73_BRAPC|nr:Gametogenetin-binding 2 [Brachionus plicatilis]